MHGHDHRQSPDQIIADQTISLSVVNVLEDTEDQTTTRSLPAVITKRTMSELGSELNQTFRILNRTDEDDFDPIFARLVGHRVRDDSLCDYSPPTTDSFEPGTTFKSRKSSTSSGNFSESFSPTEMTADGNVVNVTDESCQVISFFHIGHISEAKVENFKILNFEPFNMLSNLRGVVCVHKLERFSFSAFFLKITP